MPNCVYTLIPYGRGRVKGKMRSSIIMLRWCWVAVVGCTTCIQESGNYKSSMNDAGVLYYISGHGFGHARRCAEEIRVLRRLAPETGVHVRTLAHPDVFAGLGVSFEAVPIDRGAVEVDALTIDWRGTLEHVRQLLGEAERLIAEEAVYVRERNIRLIIADVPFVAGYVAAAAGVPCWAQGNFLWDWVYEAHTDDHGLLDAVRGGYKRMAGQLRLPFPHPNNYFPETVELPLVARRPELTPEEAATRMGIEASGGRRRVLLAMRGGLAPEARRALESLEDRYQFIYPQDALSCSTQNHVAARGAEGVSFWDTMQLCDAVVSKPGHGIVTDCAAMGVGLLYPSRNGFREDAMVLRAAKRYFRQQEIGREGYLTGRWERDLELLFSQPKPVPARDTNGAEFVARWIISKLS